MNYVELNNLYNLGKVLIQKHSLQRIDDTYFALFSDGVKLSEVVNKCVNDFANIKLNFNLVEISIGNLGLKLYFKKHKHNRIKCLSDNSLILYYQNKKELLRKLSTIKFIFDVCYESFIFIERNRYKVARNYLACLNNIEKSFWHEDARFFAKCMIENFYLKEFKNTKLYKKLRIKDDIRYDSGITDLVSDKCSNTTILFKFGD